MIYFIVGVLLWVILQFSGSSSSSGASGAGSPADETAWLEVKEEEPKELSVLDKVKGFFEEHRRKAESNYIDAK